MTADPTSPAPAPTDAPPAPGTDPTTPPPPTDPTPSGPADDPDAGAKRALEAERTARRDADKRARQLETELAQLKTAQLSDNERAIAEATQKATTETETKWRDRLIGAEVRALAATRVVDPELVSTLIDRKKLVWDGDELDSAVIAAEIDRVLAQRPYLAKPGGDPPPPPPAPETPAPPVPTVPGGPRGGGDQPDPASMSMDEFREWRKTHA